MCRSYHVEAKHRHFYSVPHALVYQPVELRCPATTVEIFRRGVRVASHVRSGQKGAATTWPEHRSKAHQKYLDRTPSGPLDLCAVSGSLAIAGTKGNAVTQVVTTLLNFVRASATSRTSAYFNSIRSSATIAGKNSQTTSAVRGGWGYSRDLNKKVFFNGFNDYEYDNFQSLDLRVVLGAGLGYHVWKNERGNLDVVGGGAFNREKM